MPSITILPKGLTHTTTRGTPLMDVLSEAGIMIDMSCGGEGTCGKCVVKILKGKAEGDSLGMLTKAEVADGYVLVCKTKVGSESLTIEIPEVYAEGEGQFTEATEDAALVRKELFPQSWQFEPLAMKWLVNVPPPMPDDGLSDLDRLTRAVQTDWGKKEVIYPLDVIIQVADTIRKENGQVTVTLIRDVDRYVVIHIEPGDSTSRLFGIAIDVGTTTIAVQLISLYSGKIIGTETAYNGQIKCGLDVISRINFAKKQGNIQVLKILVLDTINRLIENLCHTKNVHPYEIFNAVVSGNTAMIHLLLGLNPDYIRLYPYTPTLLKVPYLTAKETGLRMNPSSWVYCSPAVGSYVGGDITAGILCTRLASPTNAIHLFIDIGTNGEIVVGNNDFLMACACSAGPAFEGGGITHGMRASSGAIENVTVNPETGMPLWKVIGNCKPKGICGTGMISLISNLLTTKWIDSSGKFDRRRPSDAIKTDGKTAHYVIVAAEYTDNNLPLIINENDVANIIRAKAAIYSACSLLIRQVGIGFQDIETIYIAGGFGRYIDISHAAIIGLIPELPSSRFEYIGNASLIGSYMICTSAAYKEKQIEIANKITYIDLGSEPAYMDEYTAALFLPHTNIDLFPECKKKLL